MSLNVLYVAHVVTVLIIQLLEDTKILLNLNKGLFEFQIITILNESVYFCEMRFYLISFCFMLFHMLYGWVCTPLLTDTSLYDNSSRLQFCFLFACLEFTNSLSKQKQLTKLSASSYLKTGKGNFLS
jgi:hypothetical protein